MNLPNKLTVFRILCIPVFVIFLLADGITYNNYIPAWIVIIIISRELFISGFRTLAADQGIVLAAGWWGKFKTTFQMLMIIVLILNLPYAVFDVIGEILIWISLALTIISMIDYVVKNIDVLKN